MLWDLIQQVQIGQVQNDAQSAKLAATDAQAESRHLKSRIQTLEETVERLSLATMSLAEILRDRFSIAESEIEARIQEIDLRDGKLDGRLRAPTNECDQCHHQNAAHRRNCLY